jgi:hypothetical protein
LTLKPAAASMCTWSIQTLPVKVPVACFEDGLSGDVVDAVVLEMMLQVGMFGDVGVWLCDVMLT